MNNFFGAWTSSPIKWKISIILVAIPLVFIILYFPLPFAPAGTQPQDPHIVASYLIFNNSTHTSAKNGATGVVDYVDPSSAIVLQKTINALPSSGGKIVILPGTYSFTSAVNVNRSNIWIQGLGGGLDDNTGQGTTVKRGAYSQPMFSLKRVSGSHLYGFHLSDLALEGTPNLTDTADMIDSSDFYNTNARIQEATFENIGIKNLAPRIGAIKLYNYDNGLTISRIHGAGGSLSEIHGKVVWLISAMNPSNTVGANTHIENMEIEDMRNDSASAIYIQRGSPVGSSAARISINNIHCFAGSGTQVNATCVVVAQNGFNYDIGDVKAEFTRAIRLDGVVGLLTDVHIHDIGASDRRSVSPGNKIMIDIAGGANGARNVLIDGVNRFEGISSSNVSIAIRDNNTLPLNRVNIDNTQWISVTTKISGTGTKIETHTNLISDSFPINATVLRTVKVAHGLPFTPAKEDISLTVLEDTNVDDWGYNLLKVGSVDPTYITIKINVSKASATSTATARIGLYID